MSSHIRYVAQVHGQTYSGRHAISALKAYSELPKLVGKTGYQAAIEMAKAAGAKLWIFREPRGAKRSRYRAVCYNFGIPKPKKIAWAIADVVPPQPGGFDALLQHAQEQAGLIMGGEPAHANNPNKPGGPPGAKQVGRVANRVEGIRAALRRNPV